MKQNVYQNVQERFDKALEQLFAQHPQGDAPSHNEQDFAQNPPSAKAQEIAQLKAELKSLKSTLADKDQKLNAATQQRQQDLQEVETILSQIQPLLEE